MYLYQTYRRLVKAKIKSLGSILSLTFISLTANAELSEAKLLGLKLIDTTAEEVQEHLYNLGGFTKIEHLKRFHSQDKYYTFTNQRHSYYYEFNYNANGKLINAKQLYRANARYLQNEQRNLSTQEVAQELIKTLGEPKHIQRKQPLGMPTYLMFLWENDDLSIKLDKKNSDPYGPILVEYQIKTDAFVKRVYED